MAAERGERPRTFEPVVRDLGRAPRALDQRLSLLEQVERLLASPELDVDVRRASRSPGRSRGHPRSRAGSRASSRHRSRPPQAAPVRPAGATATSTDAPARRDLSRRGPARARARRRARPRRNPSCRSAHTRASRRSGHTGGRRSTVRTSPRSARAGRARGRDRRPPRRRGQGSPRLPAGRRHRLRSPRPPAEQLHGIGEPALAERDVPETRKRLRAPRGGATRVVERLRVEPAGGADVVEAERDLGIDERRAGDHAGVHPRREEVRIHAETLPELAQKLNRRDPLAELEPRDVRRRAGIPGELLLRQPRALARLSETVPDSLRIVDVTCLLLLQALYSWPVRARTVRNNRTKGWSGNEASPPDAAHCGRNDGRLPGQSSLGPVAGITAVVAGSAPATTGNTADPSNEGRAPTYK